MQVPYSIEDIERQPLQVFTEKAYLDYSMYVILDRALPHVGDGLKPVQRRIIYAMSELGLSATAKYKKSARTVGDVLGKFHPHGDSACYEAMVLMAQPFSYRYPLVDGQGNWGSIDDPKSFAAMRYTEARMSAYAGLLLAELEQGTVEWVDNFDGTLQEPALLPARLPHILLNGCTGIAVGMATDILPHNLKEVARACVHLLANPEADTAELCRFIQGPDFPTEAEIITPPAELLEMYEKGSGSVKMRACYTVDDGEIIITALPYQTSGAKVLAQIAAQMQAKKLPLLEDLRDESDHENPVRLVLVPRSKRVDGTALMSHLFATTDLERNYRVNMNLIGLSGRPQVKNLSTLLKEWLEFRITTVRRRLQHRLDKVTKRLHILDGLLIAFLNIDEIIRIIRLKDDPKPLLMARFALSETQVEAILELRLRQLAKLEQVKIKGEQDKLGEERQSLEAVLASESRLKTLVAEEIQSDAEKYGDPRRSPLVQREQAQSLDTTELAPAEPVTVIVSAKGWVRAAKGHDIDPVGMNYRGGDQFLAAARGLNNQAAVFFDNSGRSYALAANSFPSARSQGEPLAGRISPPDGARMLTVLMGAEEDLYFVASDAGYGFLVKFADLLTKNKAGKSVLSLPKGAVPLTPAAVRDAETMRAALVNNSGYLLIFDLKELPRMPKGKGLKLMNLKAAAEEKLEHLCILPENADLILETGKRRFTIKAEDTLNYQGTRAQRGHKLPRGYQHITALQVKAPQPTPSGDNTQDNENAAQ